MEQSKKTGDVPPAKLSYGYWKEIQTCNVHSMAKWLRGVDHVILLRERNTGHKWVKLF